MRLGYARGLRIPFNTVPQQIKKKPKIVVITCWNGKLTSTQKDEMDVDFIVKKPFDLSILLEQISVATGK